jgi:hypothetical protein
LTRCPIPPGSAASTNNDIPPATSAGIGRSIFTWSASQRGRFEGMKTALSMHAERISAEALPHTHLSL